MKKASNFIFFGAVLFLAIFFAPFGAYAEEPSFRQEAVLNFNSYVTVNTDNSLDVMEIINYDTGPLERHGIYRDIYPHSSTGSKMDIGDISVVDESGNPYIFEVYNEGRNLRIKIGDPDRTFNGQKIYTINYHVTKAVAQYEDFDEIYWNVTGNEWQMPIYKATATVFLPVGATVKQAYCYVGQEGSNTSCDFTHKESETYTFGSSSQLYFGEGLTVAVGFPKGFVETYSASDEVSGFFYKYGGWIVGGILPILTLVLSLWYWHKKGRDPKGTGVIVPQYDVPDNLTPMEVAGIVLEKVDRKHISPEIIYLATEGYIKITELEQKLMGVFKSKDYELSLLKDMNDVQNDFDKNLLFYLFNTPKPIAFSSFFKAPEKQTVSSHLDSVKLSDLQNSFYKHIPDIVTLVLNALLGKGYYKNLGRMKNSFGRVFLILFMSVWASGFIGGMLSVFLSINNPAPIMGGIFLSVIIYGTISHFSPAKTEKGVATKEYLLGLKDYLTIAEKDRLEFHNAPDKKPEVFEKLLPYAMVLGVADIWAKEFEGIYIASPSWYSGSPGAAFSAVAFSHSMSNFSSLTSSSLSSAPGGSGGGGSSGGGGGGGGGGGW